MIEAIKKIVAAVEAIPEDVEGWMPDALTDALIDAKKAIAIAEHDPYDDIFIAYGLPKQDNTSLDAICQDLQEKTYTQAMRIAELEAKLSEAEKQEPVAWAMLHDNGTFIDAICPEEHARLEGEYKHPLYTHPQPKREPVKKDWPFMGYGNIAIGSGRNKKSGTPCLLYLKLDESREINSDTSDVFPLLEDVPQEKLVACVYFKDGAAMQQTIDVLHEMQAEIGFTHPQSKREPVALRSEQFVDMARAIAPRTVMGMKEQIPNWIVEFGRAVEAAHGIKEKNT